MTDPEANRPSHTGRASEPGDAARSGRGRQGVTTRLWRAGKLAEKDFPFDRISDHLKDDQDLVWVDLCDGHEQEMTALAAELSLDPQAVEDAISHAERAKAVRYATHTFMTIYAVTMTDTTDPPPDPPLAEIDTRLTETQVSAFVFPHGIITVHTGDFDMTPVVQRWEDNADLLAYGPGALAHGLLDYIVDGHFQAVQMLDDQIEALEDTLFDDHALSKVVQQRTYRIRRDLVDLRRVVLPMRDVLNAVLRHRQALNSPPELNSSFEDLYDHVLRASEWTESLRDMISTIFETNLSLQDARLNTVMKKLTSWAAIIAVPTAITGYFGQNIPYPGFGHIWGFWLSTAAILLIALALYHSFRRRDWL